MTLGRMSVLRAGALTYVKRKGTGRDNDEKSPRFGDLSTA